MEEKLERFDKEFRDYINAGILYAEMQTNYQALDFEDEVKWIKDWIKNNFNS